MTSILAGGNIGDVAGKQLAGPGWIGGLGKPVGRWHTLWILLGCLGPVGVALARSESVLVHQPGHPVDRAAKSTLVQLDRHAWAAVTTGVPVGVNLFYFGDQLLVV